MNTRKDDSPRANPHQTSGKDKLKVVYDKLPEEQCNSSINGVEGNIDIEQDLDRQRESVQLKNKKHPWYIQVWERIKEFKKTSLYNKYSFLMEIFFLIFANILFVLANARCPFENDRTCVVRFFVAHQSRLVIEVFTAAFLFNYVLLASLYYRRINLIFSVVVLCNVIYLIFYYNPVITWENYGQVFGLALAIDFVSLLLVFSILQAVMYTYRRSKKALVVALVTVFVVFPTIFYFERVRGACDNWVYGLGRDKIDNSVGCQVAMPKECIFDWFEMMDLTALTHTCSNTPTNTQLIKKYYPNATSLIGLPRIERAPYDIRKEIDLLPGWIFENSVSLTGYDDPKAENLEMFIDNRVEGKAKVEVKIKRNETLVQERAKLDTGKGLARNVIVIFLDTLSRARIYQKLEKTVDWLEKHYNQKSSERETFQFLKYHSVGPFTKNNIWAAYGGERLPPADLTYYPAPEHPKEMFGRTYIENGYITSRVGEYCGVSTLGIIDVYRPYLREAIFDHEGSTLACDPHYNIPGSNYGLFTGPYSFVRRCLYGKDMHQHVFDYGNQFWRAYPNEKKLLMMEFIEGHEGTQEVIKYNDDAMVSFLENLGNEKLLNDTIFVLFSDHGNHIGLFPHSLFERTFNIEKVMPILFLTLPKGVANQYRKNLDENKQKLVSPFQLYQFFMSIPLGGDSPHIEKSPLGKLPDLTCDDIFNVMQICACTYDNK